MQRDEIGKYIGENSAIFPGDAEFLYDELNKLPDIGNLLELGTGYGHSCVYFSQLKPQWTIYTIDGYGEYGNYPQYFNFKHFDASGLNQTKSYIQSRGLKNIVQIIGNTNEVAWSYPVDVLFIDADHTFEGLKQDFEKYSPFAKTIFFHDYDLQGMAGNGVNDFIETIKDKWTITSQCHTAMGVRK